MIVCNTCLVGRWAPALRRRSPAACVRGTRPTTCDCRTHARGARPRGSASCACPQRTGYGTRPPRRADWARCRATRGCGGWRGWSASYWGGYRVVARWARGACRRSNASTLSSCSPWYHRLRRWSPAPSGAVRWPSAPGSAAAVAACRRGRREWCARRRPSSWCPDVGSTACGHCGSAVCRRRPVAPPGGRRRDYNDTGCLPAARRTCWVESWSESGRWVTSRSSWRRPRWLPLTTGARRLPTPDLDCSTPTEGWTCGRRRNRLGCGSASCCLRTDQSLWSDKQQLVTVTTCTLSIQHRAKRNTRITIDEFEHGKIVTVCKIPDSRGGGGVAVKHGGIEWFENCIYLNDNINLPSL